MRRSTIVVILFALIVAALIGYNQYVKQQPPVEITLAVDPLVEDWVRAAIDQYNATDPRVQNGAVRVHYSVESVIGDVKAWTGSSGWNPDKHPDLWIPSSSLAVQYYPSSPFQSVQDSLARTPLVWGGFVSRLSALSPTGAELDWPIVSDALAKGTWAALGAKNIPGNINMALNDPSASSAGLGAIFTGVATLNSTDTVTSAALNGSTARSWLTSVDDSIRGLKSVSAAEDMARFGASRVQFGLLPEAQWLMAYNDLRRTEEVHFSYPAYQFILDAPMVMWSDIKTTEVEKQAAAALGQYLISNAGQQTVLQYGWRPAETEPNESDKLFAAAASSGISAQAIPGIVVLTPARSDAEYLARELQ
jgi:hypothetical protein